MDNKNPIDNHQKESENQHYERKWIVCQDSHQNHHHDNHKDEDVDVPIDKPSVSSFSVMTYNVLAQCLIQSELYPFSKKSDLKMKVLFNTMSFFRILKYSYNNRISISNRIPKIINEITQELYPDIACLQELDFFEDTYKPVFQNSGYDCLYEKKDLNKSHGHGLCIIWKKNKFKCLKSKRIEFDGHPLTHPTTIFPETGNIGMIAAFQSIENTSSCFLVSNHHLFWRYEAEFVQLRQCYVMMKEIETFKKEWNNSSEGDHVNQLEQKLVNCHSNANIQKAVPVLMCGDWNFCPESPQHFLLFHCKSSPEIIRDLMNSCLFKPVDSVESNQDVSLSYPEEKLSVSELVHEILENMPKLSSVYGNYILLDKEHKIDPKLIKDGIYKEQWEGEPGYTTWANWKGTLDFLALWQEKNNKSAPSLTKLQVSEILEIPPHRYLNMGIPNQQFGSDHICLMAKFKFFPVPSFISNSAIVNEHE